MADYITQDECLKKQNTMAQDIKEIKKSVEEINLNVAKLPEKIIEKADARYAGKRVEVMVDRMIWLVVAAVGVALLALILK
jgi:uncharacterized protein YoxC